MSHHHHHHHHHHRRLAHSHGAHSAAVSGHAEWGAGARPHSASGGFTRRATHLTHKTLSSGNSIQDGDGVVEELMSALVPFTQRYAKSLRDGGRLPSSLVLRRVRTGEASALEIIAAGQP